MPDPILRGSTVNWEDAEACVLGSMLVSEEAIDTTFELLSDLDFHNERHKKIFAAILALTNRSANISIITVTAELEKDKSGIAVAGGVDYIGHLVASLPSADGIEDYCKIVRQNSLARRLTEAAAQITELARKPTISLVEEKIADATQILYALETTIAGSNDGELVDRIITRLDGESHERMLRLASGEKIKAICMPTWIDNLDRTLGGGLYNGEVIVVAGRPSMGKTAFSVAVARKSALNGYGVAVFSLEVPKEQVVKNLICSESLIDTTEMRRMEFYNTEDPRLKAGKAIIRGLPIIIDRPSPNISEIRSRARKYVRRNNVQLIVIDYFQLLKSKSAEKRSFNKVDEFENIATDLKAMALELNVPVIVISQLNREKDKRDVAGAGKKSRPTMSDLKGSGAIEQVADMLMFLDRDDYQQDDQEEVSFGYVYILKNRNGPTGQVQVAFHRKYLLYDAALFVENAQ